MTSRAILTDNGIVGPGSRVEAPIEDDKVSKGR
eukprot:CAMPEP_0184665992 /NCGR_PEP_ID=MMETSP0308-20130426/59543_1 /TAXON_ID=38269 /ORGANISM="Gloeochaete witrockiana, Strain SAG 46.84" /LENGTH=32 /DNA_ID= /DNA_START= /DNA_END= /DNA_ORIENTATION=